MERFEQKNVEGRVNSVLCREFQFISDGVDLAEDGKQANVSGT